LLELQWPSGRLLREYTLLLDLPVYATERAAAKKVKAASVSPQPQPKKQASVTSQTNTSRTAPNPPSNSQQPLNSNNGEYRVASGDTAWNIARKIKPDNASIMQSLAAIKQANPQAFINDNINLLKKGAVLRLPDSADISRLTPQAANAVVDFSPESAITENKTAQPQLDATASKASSKTPAADGGGRLKLAAPSADSSATSENVSGGSSPGSASGTAARGTEKLENEFAIFQEELDKTQRENQELKARLSNMEEQIATMSRMVEIGDDSLRAAQVASSLEAEEDPLSEQVTEQGGKAVAMEDSAVSDAVETVDEKTKTAEVANAQPATSINEGSATENDSTAKKDGAKDGGFDLQYWIDLLLYPFIALAAILLAIVLFFKKRKSDDEPEDELSLQSLVEKEAVEEDDDLDTDLDAEDKQVLEESVFEFDEQELKDLKELELSEGEDLNPLGEADIYLSLGNYKQAEDVLLDAISKTPDDASLRLKLSEVYVSTNELDKFDAQYQQLSELNDAEAIAKADSLRAELAANFGAGSDESDEEVSVDLDSVEQDVDVSLEEVLGLEEDVSDSPESEVSFEADTVDELLDTAVSTTDDAVEASSADFDLDLDLEDIDLGSSELELDSTDLELDGTDLENIDLDSLSSDIDAEMESFDLGLEGDASIEPTIEVAEAANEALQGGLSVTAATTTTEAIAEDDFENFDDDLDVLAGEDECSTKLELAQAYLDMGDPDSAKDILEEVVSQGDSSQQDQAHKLLEDIT
jgi:pilus assembly protein FimV